MNFFVCFETFSGDHGQLPVSGAEYIPHVLGDKSRASDTTYIEGQRAQGIASWDNTMEQSAGEYADPSLVSSTTIPSSAVGNILEENHTVPGKLLGRKNALTEEERGSQPVQSNWQVLTVKFLAISSRSVLLLACIHLISQHKDEYYLRFY